MNSRKLFLILILTMVSSLSEAQHISGTAINESERIHQQAIVVDTHNDVIYESVMKGKDIGNRINSGHTDLPRLKDGAVDVQFFLYGAVRSMVKILPSLMLIGRLTP